jgi:uncharacterized protein YbjT (DUF2867 family)
MQASGATFSSVDNVGSSLAYPSLLVLGSTGRVGHPLLRTALERGYRVKALVRDPSRLRLQAHDQLELVQGDVRDTGLMTELMRHNVDAVLSTLGTYIKRPESPMTEMTAILLDAMRRNNVRRLVCMSSLGVGESKRYGGLVEQYVVRIVLRHVLADKFTQEQLIRNSGVDWTLLRPPRILNEDFSRPYDVWEQLPKGLKPSWKISKVDAATEMLNLLENPASVGQTLHLSY